MLAVSLFWKTLPVVAVVVGVCVWAIRRFDLSFLTGLYFKTLAVLAVLVAGTWTLVRVLSDYEVTNADFGGTIISSLIFAYLVHLWIMPIDDSVPEEFGDDPGSPNAAPTSSPDNPPSEPEGGS